MIDNTGKNDNESSSIDFFGLCDFNSNPFADFSHEDFGALNIDELGCSSIQSPGLDDADIDPSPPGLDFELNDTESAIIRLATGSLTKSGGRSAAKKSEKVYVTHEDFDEGPERDAFLLIYGYAESLFDTTSLKPFKDTLKKERALSFFFCRTRNGIHLDDAVACIDMQIRVDVIRLRFMLEFWMRDWELPTLPEHAEGLPGRVELMAAQHAGMPGVAIAREAWIEPGIAAENLLKRVTDGGTAEYQSAVKKAFASLVDAYILSISNGKVYTTGKNPILELQDKANDPEFRQRGRLANLYWSRKF